MTLREMDGMNWRGVRIVGIREQDELKLRSIVSVGKIVSDLGQMLNPVDGV
ncbi:hypothetical protein PPGU19_083240 (plasmid) [Paraburkholderia sp. PGU19]|jgi:hypothetical protein|uniref:Uncharacterized protein n=1 Tax=Paraburkholderia terrae TaxID=311230 RepID=A0ABM7TLM1_9BURK|nr:hypothetical protein PPGU19_083240 [Paraburkholderia sp. PGU19]BCZ79994.1 hypothetical protein PTKU64_36690 [Paraburkholderia terrae]BDC41537.1 hypothetical protein PTKU15_48340 [Paraburkholderia terrae]